MCFANTCNRWESPQREMQARACTSPVEGTQGALLLRLANEESFQVQHRQGLVGGIANCGKILRQFPNI